MVLDRSSDLLDARAALSRLGIANSPNRVLMVKLETDEKVSRADSDRAITAAVYAIDELCDKFDDVVHTHLRGRGVCIFLHERPGSRKAGRMSAQQLAQTILHAVANRSALRVRIGVGELKPEFSRLAESYLEANLALAACSNTIAFYKQPAGVDEASVLVQQICGMIGERRPDEAMLAVQSLPFHAERQFGNNLGAQRRFLVSAVASLCVSARKLGCEGSVLDGMRHEAEQVLTRADTLLEIQQAFIGIAESLIEEVRQLHADRGSRIVERVCRMVERSLAAGESAVKQSALAASLGISASHLSRVFKQTTGQTFERYLMQRRVELAKRLLLDPANNVSTVALQCGFTDSSYFARVFRKLAGSSPAEYARNPDLRRPA
jgi:AraC-like DNA-binding protein